MSSDNCVICFEEINDTKNYAITDCGHKFCLTCLLKAAQENTSCPLCRNVLVPPKDIRDTQEVRQYFENGYGQGYEQGRTDQQEEDDEEMQLRSERNFERGYSQGVYHSKQEIDSLKDEIKRLESRLAIEIRNNQVKKIEHFIEFQNLNEPISPRNKFVTNSRAEALKSAENLRPSWIRNHPSFGSRWQR